MLPMDRRAGSRRGMTVLGKIPSVPKPINLPSQRLENRGLDPNVALVPRGTLSWGASQSTSKSPPNTRGWGGPSASPPKAAGGAWGSQPSSRPSSASTPASGMNDTAWPDIKAASSGTSSRPTSAAGKVEQLNGPVESGNGPQTHSRLTSTHTSQLLSIEHRPHSAEARTGAVSDHNRSGEGGHFMPAWRGAGDRKQGEEGSSHLSRGDFPTLGADPETKDAVRENANVGEVKASEMGRPRSEDGRGGRQGPAPVHDMEQSGPRRQEEQWRGWEEGAYGGGPMDTNWRPDGPHGENFRRGPPGGHGGGRPGPENRSRDGGPPSGRGVQAGSWRRGDGGGDGWRQESGAAGDSWRRMEGPEGGQDSWRMRGGPGSHGPGRGGYGPHEGAMYGGVPGGYPGGPPAGYMMGFRDPAGGTGMYPRPDMYPVPQYGGYYRQPGMMDDRGMGMGPRPPMDGYGPPGAPGMDRYGRFGHGQRGPEGPGRASERMDSEGAKAGGEEQHMREEGRDGGVSEEERVAKRQQLLQTSGHIDWALDSEEGNGMDFGVPTYVKSAGGDKVGEHQNAEVAGGERGGRKDGEAVSRGPLDVRNGMEGGPGFSTPRENPKESVRILKRPGDSPSITAPTQSAPNSNGPSIVPPLPQVLEHVSNSSDSGKQVPERLSPDTKVDASMPSNQNPHRPSAAPLPPHPSTPERVEQSRLTPAKEAPGGVSATFHQNAPQGYGAPKIVEKVVTRDKGPPGGSGVKSHGAPALLPATSEKPAAVGVVPPQDPILAAPITAPVGPSLAQTASPQGGSAVLQGGKQVEAGEKTGGSELYDRQREQLKEQAHRAQQRRLDTEPAQNQRRGGDKGSSKGRGEGRRGQPKAHTQSVEGPMGSRQGGKAEQTPGVVSEGSTCVNDEQARHAHEGGRQGGGRGGHGRAGHPDSGSEPHVRETPGESKPVDRMSGAVLDTPILQPPQSRAHMGNGPGEGRLGAGMGMGGGNVRSLPGHGMVETNPQAPGQHLLPTPPIPAQMQNAYSNRHMQYQMRGPPQGHMLQPPFMPFPPLMMGNPNSSPQVQHQQQQAGDSFARRTQEASHQLQSGMQQPVGLPPPPPLPPAPQHTQSNPGKQLPPPPAQVPPLTLGEAIGVHPRVETAVPEGGHAKGEGVGRHGGAGEGEGTSHKSKRKAGGGGRGGGKQRGNNGGDGHVGNQQVAGGAGRSSDRGGGGKTNDPAPPHNVLRHSPPEEATVGPTGKGGIAESVVPAPANTTGNLEGKKGSKDNRDSRGVDKRMQKPVINSTEQPSVPVTGVTPGGAVSQGGKKPAPQRAPRSGREGIVQDVRSSDKPGEGREGGGRGGRGSHAPPKAKEWVVVEGQNNNSQPPENPPRDPNLEVPKTPPPQKVRRAEMERYSPKPAVPAKGRGASLSAPGPGPQQQAKGALQVFRPPPSLPPHQGASQQLPPQQGASQQLPPQQGASQQLPPQQGAPQAAPVQQAGTQQGALHLPKSTGVEDRRVDAVAVKDREQGDTEGPAKGEGRGRHQQQRRGGSQRGGAGKEDVAVGVEERTSAPTMPHTRVAPGGRVEHGGVPNRPLVSQRGFVAQPKSQSDAQPQPQPQSQPQTQPQSQLQSQAQSQSQSQPQPQPQQPPVPGTQAWFQQPGVGPAHMPFSGQLVGRALNGAAGGRGGSRGRGSAGGRGGRQAGRGEGGREGGGGGRNQGVPRGGGRGGSGRRDPQPNSGAPPVANAKGVAAGAVQS